MSYFDDFFNIERQRTLRGYTRLLDLRASTAPLADHGERGGGCRPAAVQPEGDPAADAAERCRPHPVDERSFQAGTLGLNIDGAYKPPVTAGILNHKDTKSTKIFT